MATKSLNSSPATFESLENGFFTGKIHARMIHFWEARNPKKGNSLMGLELLLLDEKSSSIQVFISAIRIGRFQPALKPHGVYSIQNFLVTNNRISYKVSEHRFMIHFTDQTVFQEVEEQGCIAMDKFRFRSFEDFDANADANEDLCDALGQIVLINDEQTNFDSTKGKIGIHMQLKDGPIVRVTFWTGVAKKFHDALATLPAVPRVLIATAINPRKIGGLLYLNSTSATRFFFDTEVEASNEYLTWLNKNKQVGGIVDFPVSEVTKLELITLAELHTFLSSKPPQRAGFICEAKIVNVLPDYGWNYVACTKCTCKLNRTTTTLMCKNCNDSNAVGIIRYRVELAVQDKDNNDATFVVFDRDATQLVGKKATDLVEIENQDAHHVGGLNGGTIPQCLLNLIGKTFTFHVKVTEYNFSASRQTITVSRILTNKNIKESKFDTIPDNDFGISGSIIEVTGDTKIGRELQDKKEIEAENKGKRVKYD